MNAPLIRVRGLSKDYLTAAGAFRALDKVDLDIQAGEFVAVMGPSGSGKSTFMNLLGCLDSPTEGRYELAGRDVARLPQEELASVRNRELGFVFQGFNLLQRTSVEDNVALPLVYAGVSRAERRKRAREMLKRVGLERLAESLPSRISGGQQQRVAIARALVNRPRLILADEPTGNLDSQTSDEILALFSRLNQEEGISLVLVTHEPDVAEYATRVIRFHDGRLAEDRMQTPKTNISPPLAGGARGGVPAHLASANPSPPMGLRGTDIESVPRWDPSPPARGGGVFSP